jgi:hypothetical protein
MIKALITGVIFFLSQNPAFAQDQTNEKLERIAIQFAEKYFAQDKLINIDKKTPQFQFMFTLLQSLKQRDPELIKRYTLGDLPKDNLEDDLTTLRYTVYSQPTDAGTIFIDLFLNGLIADLKGSCSHSQKSTAQESSIEISLKCPNEIAKKLNSFGFASVTLKKNTTLLYPYTVYISQPEKNYRSMSYIHEEMKKDTALKNIASVFLPQGCESCAYSKSNPLNTQFEQKQKNPSLYDSVRFKYTYGWGDCMAGCISNHTWNILANPIHGIAGLTFEFDISESGAPLVDISKEN